MGEQYYNRYPNTLPPDRILGMIRETVAKLGPDHPQHKELLAHAKFIEMNMVDLKQMYDEQFGKRVVPKNEKDAVIFADSVISKAMKSSKGK